jgi:hypothetical protein
MTHILLIEKSQDTEILFRVSDGMMLGECQKNVVVFGAEPNKKTSRVFIDHENATDFLRLVADMDFAGIHPLQDFHNITGYRDCKGKALIEERNVEGLVILPPNSRELVSNGGIMPFNKSIKTN